MGQIRVKFTTVNLGFKGPLNPRSRRVHHASGSSSAAVQNAQDMQHMQAVTTDMRGDSAESVQNVWNTKRWR